MGTRELAAEVELFGNAAGLEGVVEFPAVVVAGVFTIAFASAGVNIFMLATGLVTVTDPPLVLARLVIEPSLVFETMVSFQEINLPASPPAVSEMLSVQVPLAFLSFNTESRDSGRKDPIKGQVALPIVGLARSSSNTVLTRLSAQAPLLLKSVIIWPVGERRVMTKSESAVWFRLI